MLICEFRITLPLTVEEYQIGQLFSVVETSLNETGGGEGVEILHNEPYENVPLLGGEFTAGQYTKKIYYLARKVPAIVKWVAPKGSLEIFEEAWNAYPYCKTVLTNPDYMKGNFIIKIETYHIADRGESENVHKLTEEQLAKREVVHIDIANDYVSSTDYKEKEDPSKFQSKDGRGPLKKDWIKQVEPIMTCYKLITIEFKWFGLQNKVERYIMDAERRLFNNFHRQLFCSIDRWVHMKIADIRELEDKTRADLEKQRSEGAFRGTKTV